MRLTPAFFLARQVQGHPPPAGRYHRSPTEDAFGQGRVPRLLDLPFGRQEVTINIGSVAALYKKLSLLTRPGPLRSSDLAHLRG